MLLHCIHAEKTWRSITGTDDCRCYKHTFIKTWWLWLLQHTFVKHFWLSIPQHSCVKSMTTVHSITLEGEKLMTTFHILQLSCVKLMTTFHILQLSCVTLMTTFHILQLSVSNYGRLSILQYAFVQTLMTDHSATLVCHIIHTPMTDHTFVKCWLLSTLQHSCVK